MIGISGPDGLLDSDSGGKYLPRIGQVVGGDFEFFGRNKKEDEAMFAHDFDIGFVAGAEVIDRTFILKIEEMAMVSSGFGVVENGLIRNTDLKDMVQDIGRFSGGDGTGDMEGQDQAQDIRAVEDAVKIDLGEIRGGMVEIRRLEMIFPVLVAQFKLR